MLLRKHLQGGVAKGAFSEEEAARRFAAWKTQKDSKVASKKQTLANAATEAHKAAVKAEAKVNEERAEAIAKKKAEIAAAAEAAAKAAAEAAAAAEAEAAPAENPEA